MLTLRASIGSAARLSLGRPSAWMHVSRHVGVRTDSEAADGETARCLAAAAAAGAAAAAAGAAPAAWTWIDPPEAGSAAWT